uniref:TNFAIP3-interacting protein 3 n=1 Tax=Heterorhabditis bacteriophora TaxID=37862 RepID=A0A1I7WQ93_HETBA
MESEGSPESVCHSLMRTFPAGYIPQSNRPFTTESNIIEQFSATISSLETSNSKRSNEINELSNRVQKAKLRERELSERVSGWVTFLREEKDKNYLRQLKNELNEMQTNLQEWDNKCKEVMEETRKTRLMKEILEEKLLKQQEIERDAKLKCNYLTTLLNNLTSLKGKEEFRE